MKIRHLLLSILFSGLLSEAFTQPLIVKRADKEYSNLHFATAAELYEEAVADGKGTDEVYRKLADSYFKIKDTRNAEKYYAIVAGSLDDNEAFNYAQSLLQNGKSAEAKTFLQQRNPKSSARLSNVLKTDVAAILADSVLNDIHFLGLNTSYAEFSPAPYKQGLVFVSSRDKGGLHKNVFGWNNTPFLDLYYVDTTSLRRELYSKRLVREQYIEKQKEHLYAYDNLLHTDETKRTANDANTLGYYSTYFRSGQGDTLHFLHEAEYFSHNTKYHEGPVTFSKGEQVMLFTRSNYHEGRYGTSEEKTNRLKIFVSSKNSQGWSQPKPLPFCNDEYSIGHPAFDAANQHLYFVSDMPGGQGGTDIYKVTYNNGNWGKPENIGAPINTDGNEMFPFVSQEGYLFFASDGHGGLGGLDVFVADITKQGALKNAGYPINSRKDDFGLIIDKSGKKGFFSSNRHRYGLDDDIFYFEREKPYTFTRTLEVLVVDKITGKPLPNSIVQPEDPALSASATHDNGICRFEIDPEKSYAFRAKKEKYLDGKGSINPVEDESDLLKIELENYSSTLYCLVTDRTDSAPLEAVLIRITDKKTNTIFYETKTGITGDFRKLLEDAKINDVLQYSFHFEKEGYLAKSLDFDYTITKPGEIPVHEYLDVKLDRIDLGMDIGKLIKINPIYFDLNKFNIRKDASTELDKIVAVMKENPTMVIELGSHTDCRSSASYNASLSDKRAKASAQYVISKGIDSSRIYGKGYGETKLINSCACEGTVKSSCSEQEHQLNRRTEFVIVKM
jgi:outer membrane protein OmpA-like peptidoglycan-associated protein